MVFPEEIPASQCPECGHSSDWCVAGVPKPEAGEPSVCVHCCALTIFTDKLEVRLLDWSDWCLLTHAKKKHLVVMRKFAPTPSSSWRLRQPLRLRARASSLMADGQYPGERRGHRAGYLSLASAPEDGLLSGAPVPGEPRNSLRPSGNVTSRPLARFDPSLAL
jgi:hypothetical protein